MSEHTAEYFLAQSLMSGFADRNIQAIPLYHWSTREGSRVGIESGLGVEVRVAAIFPRRPKVSTPADTDILIKFNYSLFEAKEIGSRVGLPVFAGAPLVSSLFGLSVKTECAWFEFHKSPSTDEDAFCNIDLSASPPTFYPDPGIVALSRDNLLDKAMSESTPRVWQEWVDVLKDFKHQFNVTGGHFIFGGQYKPMYVVMIYSASIPGL